ncbi:MAG: polysaccharide deacetylase family protein [Oscillospiraceae bacterium]|nr:polysaccharide deacetylase family protein [Oscillospiraceae bacterium]
MKKQRQQTVLFQLLLVCFGILVLIGIMQVFMHKDNSSDSVSDQNIAAEVTTTTKTLVSMVTTSSTTTVTTTDTTTTETTTVTTVTRYKEIYLTFDDGPCKNTPAVLDILDQYGVKATFFTVGAFVEIYPQYVKEAADRGHVIACHSFTHDFDKCYASADAFMNEVQQWKDAVETKAQVTLPERLCIRFPGGSNTKYAEAVHDGIIERLKEENYRYFDWNGGDNDKWKQGNVNGLPEEEFFMQSYYDSMGWHKDEPEVPIVFLFHDTELGSVNILPTVIQDIKERGYTFKTLDQHPEWDDPSWNHETE